MPGPVALRNTGNVIVAVAVWIFCLVALVDGILRGSADYILHDVLVAAAVSVAAWIVFFRPRLVVLDDGLRMINLLRSYDIPFASLVTWRVGGALVMEVRADHDRVRKLTSWGAPGVRRQRPQTLSVTRSRMVGAQPVAGDTGVRGPGGADLRSVTESALEYRHAQWRREHPPDAAGEEAVARSWWNRGQFLVLTVLVIANIVERFWP